MDGGFGGLDIYYATREAEGVYANPVNLGPTVNTAGDDVTPFYFDGILYFSSNGHPSIGGFDIFFAKWNGTSWDEPGNIGPGFNTSFDDKYLSLDNSGNQGTLLSNRPGGRSLQARTCCDDIFEFFMPKVEAKLIVGVFTEGKKPLKGSTVSLNQVTS